MKISAILAAVGVFAGVLGLLLIPKWVVPPIHSTQYGPNGSAMWTFEKKGAPAPGPEQPEIMPAVATTVTSGGGGSGYRNVTVLTDVSKAEFDRTMVAITKWVAPKQGCAFCHAGTTDYAADTPRKEIARRMLAMTRTINAGWTNHVGAQGVTCFSCHQGNNIPVERWYLPTPKVPPEGGLLGKPQEWNTQAKTIRGFFPNVPDKMFLLDGLPANGVEAHAPLTVAGQNVAQHDRTYAEHVYVEMMQMANGIGTNCTYCHNSRSLSDWSQSPPWRYLGFTGLKMTAAINREFLNGLAQWTPAEQRGPMGDSAKATCKTCHGGRTIPAGGMQRVAYPALIGPPIANDIARANPAIPLLARTAKVGVPGSETVKLPEVAAAQQ